ncbi:MAG: HD domain-containing protein [Candidatus Micrarchaeota archaeon]|nr:HD domain-containing protein [Candidatus Micrarchaeota archaeon]
MELRDPIYGRFKITEPVIKELLRCKDLNRLKYVSQSGLKSFDISRGTSYSRWEHSVGVMLLLRKLNAGLNEQVAGLLHDSSHTAFSHVIDFVFQTQKNENYAGDKLKEFIENSAISMILGRHGISTTLMGDYEVHNRFQLLERPIPELCADRIDNGLRYMLYSKIDIDGCTDDLIVKNNRIVFKSRLSAKRFAKGYLDGTKKDWGNAETGLRAHFLSEAIKRGLEKDIINISQFHTDTERSIINSLKASKDEKIKQDLRRVNGKLKFIFDRDGDIYVKEKVRYVDPMIIEKGKTFRLTEVDIKYKKAIYDMKEMLRKGYKIRLINV